MVGGNLKIVVDLERLGIKRRRAEVTAVDDEIDLFFLGARQYFFETPDAVGCPVIMNVQIGKYRKSDLLHAGIPLVFILSPYARHG